MKTYDKIEEMLCDELDEIAKKHELTSSNLEIIDKAIDVIKDISVIREMAKYDSEGYSNDGYSGTYYDRYPYYMYEGDAPGNSYARGRGTYAKRDSMGRYSRDSHNDYSNEGYSRDTASELQRMMDNAKNDKEREALRHALSSMRNM